MFFKRDPDALYVQCLSLCLLLTRNLATAQSTVEVKKHGTGTRGH